ncbi:MAG: cyclohexanone monooxygenase, partial [Pseudomonadota bacterium]|nr:cyclohexanone monooxygenase [Pseudomonadota bacterium]
PNVQLVNVKEHPIEEITAEGLIHKDQHYQFDMIIYATGFDAMTGSLLKIDITGKDGISLQDKWLAGPRTYLGLCTYGFPNFFTVSGPGSPSVLSNMIITIEQHVNWIIDCMTHLRDNNLSTIEALEEAENDWVTQTNEIANGTLFPTCNSWYLGANVPGKPRIFMPFAGGFPTYAKICSEVAEQNYRGFVLSA